MKKAFKGLFTAFLAIGFLAGCKAVTHTVEFYTDNVGAFFKEVQVKDGAKVEDPGQPEERTGYDWKGWWVDEVYSAEFDFTQPIKEDKEVIGKWQKQYVPDTRQFHVVGDLANTELSYINWDVEGNEDPKSYLTKAEDSNLYSIELEIGYNATLKVKIPAVAWDSEIEFDWTKIKDANDPNVAETGIRNIQVKNAGKYRIEVETTDEWIQLVRLGDATGAGVKPNPVEGAIDDWGLVGTPNEWGKSLDIPFTYNEDNEDYSLVYLQLKKGDEFKLRTDNSWGQEKAPSLEDIVPAEFIKIHTKVENDVTIADPDKNYEVLKDGFFSFYFDKEILTIVVSSFVLRGDALPVSGWDADSEALVAAEPVANTEGTELTVTYTGNFAMVAGAFKVKMADFDGFNGWDVSFGDAEGKDFTVAAAGNYTVTLVVTYVVATHAITAVASFAAAA